MHSLVNVQIQQQKTCLNISFQTHSMMRFSLYKDTFGIAKAQIIEINTETAKSYPPLARSRNHGQKILPTQNGYRH